MCSSNTGGPPTPRSRAGRVPVRTGQRRCSAPRGVLAARRRERGADTGMCVHMDWRNKNEACEAILKVLTSLCPPPYPQYGAYLITCAAWCMCFTLAAARAGGVRSPDCCSFNRPSSPSSPAS